MIWTTTVGLAVMGYLSGSVPFGLLLTRAFGLGDIREIGSGNIGATNVLRTGSKKIAILTLLCDLAKGFVPVLAGAAIAGTPGGMIAGTAAFIGHILPVWLNFKGGKGVATYLGAVLGLAWTYAVGFCAIWLIMAVLFRYSSLSALCASAAAPLVAWIAGDTKMALWLAAMAILIFTTHRENLARLLRGEETRINLSGKSTSP